MPAVIAHQHDNGFTTSRVLLEAIEEPADLTIDKGDRRVIGADRRIPLIVGNDVLVIAQAFVEWFVGVRSREARGTEGRTVSRRPRREG